MARKVLVALSGGVDSAVAALILKNQGYKVTGAYIQTWAYEESLLSSCPWEEDIIYAQKVAQKLGIDFEKVNFIEEYRQQVVQYIIDGYSSGITPNPDVMCNRKIKFGVFLDYAQKNGFDAVATGHYCRKLATDSEGYQLLEGVDKNKDQSYFLALINQTQLSHIVFPIGEYTKQQIRHLARENGLPNADRKDSQGICFLGKVKMNHFLEQFIPQQPGDIVRSDGSVLGQHKGLHRYTIGQRRGINIPSNTDYEHYVVVGKDLERNHLIVAFDHTDSNGLFANCFQLHALSFINKPLTKPIDLHARPRYRDPQQAIHFIPNDKSATITFQKSQRALAAGQVCAFYQGEQLLGGGIYC